MILLLPLLADAACTEHALADALDASTKLELAFTTLDDPLFDQSAFALDNSIPCIAEPISLPDVLALHRAKGLAAFVLGDPEASRAAWGAIRDVQTDALPPSGLMPVGHPMLALWVEAKDLVGPTRPLPVRPPGGWTVDGVHTDEAPVLHAYLLQGFDLTGRVVYTGWYRGYADPPEIPGVVMESTAPPPKRHTGRYVAVGVGGGLLVGAGVATIGSLGAAHASTTVDNADAPDKIKTSRALGGAAIGLAAAGAVSATLAFTMKW